MQTSRQRRGDRFDHRWARLDYMWLKPGAKRAEMAVHRGNQGAALLMSYCRAQSIRPVTPY